MLEVERLGHDPADHVAELIQSAGPWSPEVAHMAANVELGIVRPDGVLDPERHLDDALAEARHQLQPVLHVGDELLVAGSRPLDQQDAADADVDLVPLGEQLGHVG